jgi:hypothetical protein
MRLEKLAQDYIRYKQALGARFKTDAMHLGVFFELLNGRQSNITCPSSTNISGEDQKQSRTGIENTLS